jgi:hypothetical protein
MDYKIPEPAGNVDWGNLAVDLLASIDNLESLRKKINQTIREKLYLAYLWYLKYKDTPKDYLIDHDVSVEFYKSLFDDPTANEPSDLYLGHLLQHAFVGGEIPKYNPYEIPGIHESPSKEYGNHFEERNGKRYIKLKIDPPYFKPLEPKLNDLGLPDKEFYTTKEVCGVLDLHPDTFRYRLRKGIYPEPKYKAGDKRRFTYEEAKEIIRITKAMPRPKYHPRKR